MQLRDARCQWVCDPAAAVDDSWWRIQLSAGVMRRLWLGLLYSDVAVIDWRSPVTGSGLLRWLRESSCTWPRLLFSSGRPELAPEPWPLVRGFSRTSRAPQRSARDVVTPNLNALTGCPETGSADCAAFVAQLWTKVGQGRGAELLPLPATWVYSHLMRLSVGFIPRSLLDFIPPQVNWLSRTFLKDFHMGMVARLAEVLRRRECLISAQSN